MPKKSRTKKKHNSFKRATRLFSNATIWSWESMTDPHDVQQRISHAEANVGFVTRSLNQDQVQKIVDRPHNWVLCCRSLCWTGSGDPWVEHDALSFRNLRINELVEHYDEMRKYILTQCQYQHIYDIGWIIQTFNKNDKIDNGLELRNVGEATELRRTLWLQTEQDKNKNDESTNTSGQRDSRAISS